MNKIITVSPEADYAAIVAQADKGTIADYIMFATWMDEFKGHVLADLPEIEDEPTGPHPSVLIPLFEQGMTTKQAAHAYLKQVYGFTPADATPV